MGKNNNLIDKRRSNIFYYLAAVLALTIVAIFLTHYDVVKGITSPFRAIIWAATNFYPTAASLNKLGEILGELWLTLLSAMAATMTASVLALLLAILGARTTRPHPIFTVVARGVGSFFRNVPLVAWAMILMLSFGQSPLTGFLALFLGSLGFLTRAFMESLDEVGEDVIEALKATGASSPHIIAQAVLPSCLPQIVSWLLFMLETNIRDATLVGFLTGTGIGFVFEIYYNNFDYHATSLVVLVTVILVIVLENLSNTVRRIIL